MRDKQKLGQFFTTNSTYILSNLLDTLPPNVSIIDPFAGNLDLLKILPSSNFQTSAYDISPLHSQIIKRDTLLNPPNYQNSWILTNPPYLARNKNPDKTIYNHFQVNDLYKAALKTFSQANGGIIVLPVNFLCDEDDKIRREFFDIFQISRLNIFEEQVFSDTSYTVCSFSFIRHSFNNPEQLAITTTFFPSQKQKELTIYRDQGFRLGGEFYREINNTPSTKNIKISRLLINSQNQSSNIFLNAIDTGSKNGRIRLQKQLVPFYGKNTDRAFASLVFSVTLSEESENLIISEFNRILENFREQYNSVFLTNYRNSTAQYARKRISFETAYQLVKYVMEINKEKIKEMMEPI